MTQEIGTPVPEATLPLSAFTSQLRSLKGEMLTIIDASIPDDRRCKAVKDLTHKAFQDRINYIEYGGYKGSTNQPGS